MKTVKLGHTGTMSEKGWVVIPKEYRDLLGLTKGSEVVIVYDGEGVYVAPKRAESIAEAAAMFAGHHSLTDDIIKERRRERKDEEQRLGRRGVVRS